MDNSTAVEIPPFFLCPISLEIMKDPVIVSTGITYDRQSIEKWLVSGKNNTCPVSKQTLISNTDLTPNVTLRPLIQSWCTINSSSQDGIQRFPTPRPPINKIQIVKLLNEANKSPPQIQIKCLKRLRSLASYNETNKRSIEIAGAHEFLATLVNDNNNNNIIGDEALSLLYNLHLSDSALKTLFFDVKFLESLIRIMQRGSYESRVYAVLLLTSMADQFGDQIPLTTLPQDIFVEFVEILGDQICPKATNATLKLLARVCPLGRNRIKAVESGLVTVLIELLLESTTDKKTNEMMLVVLELLCQCADGRAEFLKHGAGLAMVSKKILRVSQLASERAVKIIHSISKFSGTISVVQEMLSLGVVNKLCLVLQVVESGNKMKERVREIFKQNAWAWKNSPCIPTNVYLLTYPSFLDI